MKRAKKLLGVMLSMIMLFGITSQIAFAESAGNASASSSESAESAGTDESKDLPSLSDSSAAENAPQETETVQEDSSSDSTESKVSQKSETKTVPDNISTGTDSKTGGKAAVKANAPAAPKSVTAEITKFTIQNLSGKDADRVYYSDTFYLAMDWDAGSVGADLHEGDFFDITLPDEMVFPSDSAAANFHIYGEDGTTVIAEAHVTPGAGNKGGTVRVTFNSWVEGRENVKGNIRLSAQFDREQIKTDEANTFQIEVGSQVGSVTVTITGPKKLSDEILGKWGQSAQDKNEAEWYIRINHKKATLSNTVISDHLSEGTSSETYLEDSFKLLRVEFDDYGHVEKKLETVDLTGKLKIASDKRSFTLDLGSVNGDQYSLYYRTTYTPGTTLRNNMTLKSTEGETTRSATHISSNSGGSASGDLANRIKIMKAASDDKSVLLAGAVFTVTKPDGSTFELTTGADGTVISGPLTQGTYKVREKTAPAGYELNDQEFTLEVTSAGAAILTVTDQPIRPNINTGKISVSGRKIWDDADNQDGIRPGAITVNLFADGVKTAAVTVTADNGWNYSFPDLPKYNSDGKEIAYTITEDSVSGYTSSVSGDSEKGFTITNTHKPERKPAARTGRPNSSAPKTGDVSNITLYAVALAASLLVLFLLIRRRLIEYRKK